MTELKQKYDLGIQILNTVRQIFAAIICILQLLLRHHLTLNLVCNIDFKMSKYFTLNLIANISKNQKSHSQKNPTRIIFNIL